MTLVALIAELVLPLVPPHLTTMSRIVRNADDAGSYELVRGAEVSFSGMFERISPPILWNINQEGLRASGPIPPLSDRYRIAIYGDSEAFGWSVVYDETLARRMERIDASVEALNLGVPGYNVTDVANHIETTLPRYRPDLVLYLVNKNDLDAPIAVPDEMARSHLLLRLRFLYQVLIAKPWRKRARSSQERLSYLGYELERIAFFARTHETDLMLAFLRTRTLVGAHANAPAGGLIAIGTGSGTGSGSRISLVDVHSAVLNAPELDSHLAGNSFRRLAESACRAIAGQPSACVPKGWNRL